MIHDIFQAEWLLRLALSLALGLLIGYERSFRTKEVGIRTHAIVCLAACMLMILSKYGFPEVDNKDPTRIAAAIVTGVGFLGSSIIFVKRDVIRGLATASGIWATAGIGMTVGAGLYTIAIVVSCAVMVIQSLFQKVLVLDIPKDYYRMIIETPHLDLSLPYDLVSCDCQEGLYTLVYELKLSKSQSIMSLAEEIRRKGVRSVKIERT